MSERQGVYYDIPTEWTDNLKKKLCPVCGKTKGEFAKGKRIYCSSKCTQEYYSHIHVWQDIADEVLKENGRKCNVCGITDQESTERNQTKKKRDMLAWIKSETGQSKLQEIRNSIIVDADKLYSEATDTPDEQLVEKYHYRMGVPEFSDYSGTYTPVSFEVDHIKAITNGGHAWDKSNLQVLCKECHKKKTAEDLKEKKEAKVSKQ